MQINKNYSIWPSYSNKEIKSVNNVLKSGKVNYLNRKIGNLFEKNFQKKWVSTILVLLQMVQLDLN